MNGICFEGVKSYVGEMLLLILRYQLGVLRFRVRINQRKSDRKPIGLNPISEFGEREKVWMIGVRAAAQLFQTHGCVQAPGFSVKEIL